MKKVILLVILLLVSNSGFAKKKPKSQPVYDHVGHIAYHPGTFHDLLEGRNDLFYDGDYTCTPGTEHYAPDCRKHTDWVVTEMIAYNEVSLDDGSILIIPLPSRNAVCMSDAVTKFYGMANHKKCEEPWQHTEKTTVLQSGDPLSSQLLGAAASWERRHPKPAGSTMSAEFRYAVNRSAEIQIDPKDMF